MARFYLTPENWLASPTLSGDEARHLSQVLRIQPGESITVFDGYGRRASAEVLAITRESVTLKLGESHNPPSPLPAITLAQAVPKGKMMDLIVQKSVELGISAIQPLITRHTIVQPGEGKAEKWRRTALEACKQCGQDTLPRIAEPCSLENWLAADASTPGLKLIASLAAGALPFRETLRSHPGTTAATLLIGPEGDFSPQEMSAALEAGFTPVSLGPIVLRVETATFFCLSVLRYEFTKS